MEQVRMAPLEPAAVHPRQDAAVPRHLARVGAAASSLAAMAAVRPADARLVAAAAAARSSLFLVGALGAGPADLDDRRHRSRWRSSSRCCRRSCRRSCCPASSFRSPACRASCRSITLRRAGALLPRRAARHRAEGRRARGVLAAAGRRSPIFAAVDAGLASLRLARRVELRRSSMRRVIHLVRKELLELRQDPRLFGIVIIAPIVQLTMLGYAATTDVQGRAAGGRRRRPIAGEPRADRPVRGLGQLHDRRPASADRARSIRWLERGEAWMALAIPPDYGERVAARPAGDAPGRRRRHRLELHDVALGYAPALIGGYAQELLPAAAPAAPAPDAAVIEPRIRVWFNPRAREPRLHDSRASSRCCCSS